MHEEYSKTLAGSRLLHCMVSAPFPATVLKQSKQIKVLQGITSQNTLCMLREYNIYKCQKIKGLRRLSQALTATRAQFQLRINQN